jgi:hypothetical protein
MFSSLALTRMLITNVWEFRERKASLLRQPFDSLFPISALYFSSCCFKHFCFAKMFWRAIECRPLDRIAVFEDETKRFWCMIRNFLWAFNLFWFLSNCWWFNEGFLSECIMITGFFILSKPFMQTSHISTVSSLTRVAFQRAKFKIYRHGCFASTWRSSWVSALNNKHKNLIKIQLKVETFENMNHENFSSEFRFVHLWK